MCNIGKVHYQDRGDSRKYNPVTYIVFGNQVVFMGMTSDCTSTINAAEEIVNAIIEKEHLDPCAVTFYDLQTHMGYKHIKQGKFIIDELTCRVCNGVVVAVTNWREGHCDYTALRNFQGYICDSFEDHSHLENVGPVQGRFHPVVPIQF